MSRLGATLRFIVRTAATLLLLGLVAGMAVAGLALMTLPPSAQTLRIGGLSAPVDISFDSHGVPRIRAATELDAAAALGFVHARDRMFQLELLRRAASGRLAEIAGARALPLDRLARTLGERRHAEAVYAGLPPEVKSLLLAYSAGVNAWIATRGRLASPEFLMLGRPEPWTPVDSMLWAETVSLWLSHNYTTELARQALLPIMPLARSLQLYPVARDTPAPDAPVAAPVRQGLLDALPRFPAPFTLPGDASDEWAVDGHHSATGAPLLAGDPHLALGFPGLWYLARIETPAGVLAGATAPGLPFLVIGRNSHIAWTFTSSEVDTQDVFAERVLADGRYVAPDGPKLFTTRQEHIGVRFAPDDVITVRESRHGPVLSDLDPGAPKGQVMAVSIAALQLGSAAPGILALDRAKTVAEAGVAAARITAPVQNLMVADHDGIGFFTTGAIPVRRAGDGSAPVSGEDGAHDWIGWKSGDDLPHEVAPASGRLMNGNERMAPADFPVFLGRDFPAPWRGLRMHERLDAAEALTLDDFTAMQVDADSVFARRMLPILRDLPRRPDVSGTAAGLLDHWDGVMRADAPQPLIFNAWMQRFVTLVLAANRVPEEDAGLWEDFAAWVLTPAGADWCAGDCQPTLRAALLDATGSLVNRFGSDPTSWRWGDAHLAVFSHPLLGDLPGLGWLASRRVPVDGDDTTLFRGGNGILGDFTARHGGGYRGAYDLADPERSRFMVAPGQSGNFLSSHAFDMLPLWQTGATVTISGSPDRVTATARLEP